MINVNQYEIQYTRTSSAGILAGIPCECHMGVPDPTKGKEAFDSIVQNDPDSLYTNFKITTRGHEVKTI